MKKWIAECCGTFCLVLAGTGAIVINDVSGGAITHIGVALTFGLIVTAMIYTVGDVSGAHLNPAVTLGFWAAGRFPGRQILPYLAGQMSGALLASGLLRMLFPVHGTLGATLPQGSVLQSFVLETFLTLLLMLVIFRVSHGAREKGMHAAIAIGAMVALEAALAGPISGASMNPARSLGPALVSGHTEHLWIYLTATVLGAQLAVPLCRLGRVDGCCRKAA